MTPPAASVSGGCAPAWRLPIDGERRRVGVEEEDARAAPVGGRADGVVVLGAPAVAREEGVPARFVDVAAVAGDQRHLHRRRCGNHGARGHAAVDQVARALVQRYAAFGHTITVKVNLHDGAILLRHDRQPGVFEKLRRYDILTHWRLVAHVPQRLVS
jgi:hypothetical protein